MVNPNNASFNRNPNFLILPTSQKKTDEESPRATQITNVGHHVFQGTNVFAPKSIPAPTALFTIEQERVVFIRDLGHVFKKIAYDLPLTADEIKLFQNIQPLKLSDLLKYKAQLEKEWNINHEQFFVTNAKGISIPVKFNFDEKKIWGLIEDFLSKAGDVATFDFNSKPFLNGKLHKIFDDILKLKKEKSQNWFSENIPLSLEIRSSENKSSLSIACKKITLKDLLNSEDPSFDHILKKMTVNDSYFEFERFMKNLSPEDKTDESKQILAKLLSLFLKGFINSKDLNSKNISTLYSNLNIVKADIILETFKIFNSMIKNLIVDSCFVQNYSKMFMILKDIIPFLLKQQLEEIEEQAHQILSTKLNNNNLSVPETRRYPYEMPPMGFQGVGSQAFAPQSFQRYINPLATEAVSADIILNPKFSFIKNLGDIFIKIACRRKLTIDECKYLKNSFKNEKNYGANFNFYAQNMALFIKAWQETKSKISKTGIYPINTKLTQTLK